MPYISREARKDVQSIIDSVNAVDFEIGVLNYIITKFCLYYIKHHKASYQTYNDVIGVLECAKMEMYRRMVVPYETKKRNEHGEVYN